MLSRKWRRLHAGVGLSYCNVSALVLLMRDLALDISSEDSLEGKNMSRTVSGLIIPTHKWPERSTVQIDTFEGEEFLGGAELNLLTGDVGVAEFGEVWEYDEGVSMAVQCPSHPGCVPTNWMPNVVATLVRDFLGSGELAAEPEFSLADMVWGDVFILGQRVVNGEKMYCDLTLSEEGRILRALDVVDYLYF